MNTAKENTEKDKKHLDGRPIPHGLCARVLKGRYFPCSDFLNAHAPRSASATWRNILAGRELLKHGDGWGIGDGKHVNIRKFHMGHTSI